MQFKDKVVVITGGAHGSWRNSTILFIQTVYGIF